MVTDNHYRWDFIQLSTDEKPTPATSKKVTDGSTLYTSDDSKLYVWYKTQWYEKEAASGGTSDFDELTNRPKYNGTAMTGETDIPLAPSITQTAGNSTTEVMSQNATTGLIYYDPETKSKINIGSGNTINGNYPISIGFGNYAQGNNEIVIGRDASAGGNANHFGNLAIGYSAEANAGNYRTALGYMAKAKSGNNSVALGSFAVAGRVGEVNIGTGTNNYGYNSTSYRVLGGVHDGQESHDAVNVEQVNGLIDAINTALSVNIPHIGTAS